jgi:hypothetical protein
MRETGGGFASGTGRWVWALESLRCSTPPYGAQGLDLSTLSTDEHLKGIKTSEQDHNQGGIASGAAESINGDDLSIPPFLRRAP